VAILKRFAELAIGFLQLLQLLWSACHHATYKKGAAQAEGPPAMRECRK
jgi:hypothetical protein